MGRKDWDVDDDLPEDDGASADDVFDDDETFDDDENFDEDEAFDDSELGLEDLTEEDIDWDDDLDDLDTDGRWREGAGDDDWN